MAAAPHIGSVDTSGDSATTHYLRVEHAPRPSEQNARLRARKANEERCALSGAAVGRAAVGASIKVCGVRKEGGLWAV